MNIDFEGGPNYTLNHENENQSFSLDPIVRGKAAQICTGHNVPPAVACWQRRGLKQLTTPVIKPEIQYQLR